MTIGKTIRQLRKERGLTQEQLGSMLGVQKAAVQKYEKGTVKNLKQGTVTRLCEIFNVTPSVFYDAVYDTDRLSREVKLLDELSILFGADSVDMLECYRCLNDCGKKKLMVYAADLLSIGKYKGE